MLLNIGTNVAGSVEAIIAPINRAVIELVSNVKPIICCITNADIKTPILDNNNTDNFTFFSTFKLISLPPRYNINAEPKVNIN